MASDTWWVRAPIPNWGEMTKEEQEIASLRCSISALQRQLYQLEATEGEKRLARQKVQRLLDKIGGYDMPLEEETRIRNQIDELLASPSGQGITDDTVFFLSKAEANND